MPIIRQNIIRWLISTVIASGIVLWMALVNPFPSVDRFVFNLFLDFCNTSNLSDLVFIRQDWRAVVANLAFVFIFILCLRIAGFKMSVVICILFCAALGGISAATLVCFHAWFSPLIGWIIIFIIYPVWHWQCILKFQQRLETQIQRWIKTPALLGVRYTRPDTTGWSIDPIQDKFDELDIITRQIQDIRSFAHRALDSFPGAILATDDEWRISLFNHYASKLIVSEKSLYDMPLLTFLEALGVTEIAHITNILHTSIQENRVETLQIKSEQRAFSVSIAPFSTDSHEKTGLAVCMLDVSAEHHARETREALMQFLSHDIRSPISSIIMAIDAACVAEKKASEENDAALLERLRYYAFRSLRLADNFLHLSRAECINPETFEPIELMSVIDIAIDGIWPQAQARCIRLAVDGLQVLPDGGAWVMGDRTLLIRMMTNLLQNAVTYSSEGTVVSVSLRSVNGYWQISVSDQGQGIALEQLPLLFEKFKRLPGNASIAKNGTGLGLTIVKTIVDRHCGKLDVQSAVGKGTCFIVMLPAIDVPQDEE